MTDERWIIPLVFLARRYGEGVTARIRIRNEEVQPEFTANSLNAFYDLSRSVDVPSITSIEADVHGERPMVTERGWVIGVSDEPDRTGKATLVRDSIPSALCVRARAHGDRNR